MTTQWRAPEAIDAIVAALSTTELVVWDGPITTGDYRDAVYIGYDADPAGDQDLAITTSQQWASIGQRKRDEENIITCAVVAILGDEAKSWKPARDKVAAMLEIVGQTLRDDPSLGLTGAAYSVAEWSTGNYFQEPGPRGDQARLLFMIRHKTRV